MLPSGGAMSFASTNNRIAAGYMYVTNLRKIYSSSEALLEAKEANLTTLPNDETRFKTFNTGSDSIPVSQKGAIWMIRSVSPQHHLQRALFEMTKHIPIPSLPDHPYFTEDEEKKYRSDRHVLLKQPSPGHHLTDEVQQMWKVMKGADPKGCDLDYTGIVVEDDDNKLIVYNPVPLGELVLKQLKPVLANKEVIALIAPNRTTCMKGLSEWCALAPNAQLYASDSLLPILRTKVFKNSIIPLSHDHDFCKQYGLMHVLGDPDNDEYVMYHESSKTLCTCELYYGPYTDMDPCNTWTCRAWFKFARQGDCKSSCIPPNYRKSSIEKHGNYNVFRKSLGALCSLDIQSITFNHGTPPLFQKDCKDVMMNLWTW
eukprot:PhF_6_TR9442/c0_g1_i1/m.14756